MHNQQLSDKHADYYEAILQIRPKNIEVYNFVKEMVDKRENCRISKEDVLKTGVDLYMTNQKFTVALGKRLREKFKGKTLITRQLFSINRNTSRKVYRVTVLFRMQEQEQII